MRSFYVLGLCPNISNLFIIIIPHNHVQLEYDINAFTIFFHNQVIRGIGNSNNKKTGVITSSGSQGNATSRRIHFRKVDYSCIIV